MKKENIYREAREKYNEENPNPMSREEAVEKLHISVATLGRYETGESEPNPDVVHAMSKVYENPALRRGILFRVLSDWERGSSLYNTQDAF